MPEVEEGPAVEYRPEAPEAAAFVGLFSATGWDPEGRLTVDGAREALARSWYAVSAYDRDRLVGTGRIVGDGLIHALLADVIVDPEYRGRGIGEAIVRRLVEECRRAGIFDTQLFAAPGVRPFYERLGFVARPDDAPGMELAATE